MCSMRGCVRWFPPRPHPRSLGGAASQVHLSRPPITSVPSAPPCPLPFPTSPSTKTARPRLLPAWLLGILVYHFFFGTSAFAPIREAGSCHVRSAESRETGPPPLDSLPQTLPPIKRNPGSVRGGKTPPAPASGPNRQAEPPRRDGASRYAGGTKRYATNGDYCVCVRLLPPPPTIGSGPGLTLNVRSSSHFDIREISMVISGCFAEFHFCPSSHAYAVPHKVRYAIHDESPPAAIPFGEPDLGTLDNPRLRSTQHVV
ncbi:hypothetical protein CCHR01_05605 [Colletotrichum chrysophilum]|uniref:Uncharacterized protein n=1 Tax=Colletotrichum chrysophilum TaxID=1836956 RepID=A0AAD9EKJ0_9PEZI|nr:hypothetical protein CCHR01_05605 [Colletotrichum chrysophilum]